MKTEKKLCELPASEFELGGSFDAACRKAGYASGKAAANELGLWSASLADALETIGDSDRTEPELAVLRAENERLRDALKEWTDEPMSCRCNLDKTAPQPNCDCWACLKISRSLAALAERGQP